MNETTIVKAFAVGMLFLGGCNLASMLRCELAAAEYRHAQLGYDAARATYEARIDVWEDSFAEKELVLGACAEQLEAAGLAPPWEASHDDDSNGK